MELSFTHIASLVLTLAVVLGSGIYSSRLLLHILPAWC